MQCFKLKSNENTCDFSAPQVAKGISVIEAVSRRFGPPAPSGRIRISEEQLPPKTGLSCTNRTWAPWRTCQPDLRLWRRFALCGFRFCLWRYTLLLLSIHSFSAKP